MKRQTHTKLATGILLLFTIAIVAETGFSRVKSGNRYEYRYQKDTPVDTKAETKNEATGSTANVGDGTAPCRDSVLLLNTVFDSNSDQGKSRFTVGRLTNNQTATFECTKAIPKMKNSDGFDVESGQVTVRCKNGTTLVESSNCYAISQEEWNRREALRLAEEERKRKAAEAEAARIAAEKAAAEKAAAEKAAAEAAAAAAAAAANPQCYSCSASATCVVTSTRDISKNSSVTTRTTYYACSNGNSRVVYNSGASGCVTGRKVCSTSSSGK
ncbi:hypothetical protein [Bdellovibrio sp. HCB209]|uniref:hypothetical protein n=1 Tax=Bdellovibrio sp. HCB209 TaxID=3394354 RepID=UPI0039B6454C